MSKQTKHTDNSDRWLISAFNSIAQAVIITDNNDRIVKMNSAAADMFSADDQYLETKRLKDIINLLDSKTRDTIDIPDRKVLEEEETHTMAFERIILTTPADNQVICNLSATSIISPGGETEGSLFIFTDIGNQIEKEQKLLDDIRNMAGSIALDFSNWLNTIIFHATSVTETLIPSTEPHDQALNVINAAEEANNTIQRLLALARDGAAREEEDKIEPTNIDDAITDAVALISSSFEEKNIEIKLKHKDSTPPVMCSQQKLVDCMVNIFMNSAEAMPEGGTITIDTMDKVQDEKLYTILRIRDNGSGMPKDVLENIFEPFYSTKSGSSIGLGLTMVRSAIENWDGFIKVRSRVDQGTSIRLFLPATDIVPQYTKKRSRRTAKETILIADDRLELLKEASQILKDAGYTVHTASGGNECITIYQQKSDEISLAIVDLIMPDIDGKTVLEEILKINPKAPVIISSGFSRDYIRGFLERGAWGFAQKPFEKAQLLNTVRRTIDKSAERMKKGTL